MRACCWRCWSRPCVGTWGLHAYPGADGQRVPGADCSSERPFVFQVLAYGYADAVVHDAVSCRVARDVAARDRRLSLSAARRGHARLPPYPTPESRPAPTLVLGETHFARAPGRAPRPDVADDSAARALHGRDDSGRGRHRQDVGVHVSVRRSTAALAGAGSRTRRSAAWCWK